MGIKASPITRTSDIGSRGQLVSWSGAAAWETVYAVDGAGIFLIEVAVKDNLNTKYTYQVWSYNTGDDTFDVLIDIGDAGAIKTAIQLSGANIQLQNVSSPAPSTVKAAVKIWEVL